jgi:hypothetical protein
MHFHRQERQTRQESLDRSRGPGGVMGGAGGVSAPL